CASDAASAQRDGYRLELQVEARARRELSAARVRIVYADPALEAVDYLDEKRIRVAAPAFAFVPGEYDSDFIRFDLSVESDEFSLLLPPSHYFEIPRERTLTAYARVLTPDDE